MRTVNLTSAKGGINRLRVKGGVSTEVLFDLHNGYVTAARTCKSRPGSVVDTTLPPGTKGLCAFNGGLVVFATAPVEIADPRYSCEVIFHPTDQALGLKEIHFASPFLGYLYVVAEFEDGSVFHYWMQRGEAWKPDTVYREGAIVEPTQRNGVAYRARRIGPPNPLWAPDVEREIGDRVEPTSANGYYYEAINLLAPDTEDPVDTGGDTPPGEAGSLAVSGALPDGYVGVPYYNASLFEDAFKVAGGLFMPAVTGDLPPGLTFDKGDNNRRVNVYGIPLVAGTHAVTVNAAADTTVTHAQSLTIHPRPSFGTLDFTRRSPSRFVAMVDAHTARFDSAGGILGLVGLTSGKAYAEVTVAGSAVLGIHAANVDNPTISDTGNPAGTYGISVGPGTYGIALDGGKVWISNAAGVFPGDPAAGTGALATLGLTYGDAYRLAINGASGAVAVANFGNSAWAHTPPAGFAGWALPVAAVPAIWSSEGAHIAEIDSPAVGAREWPNATEAGVLDAMRTTVPTGTYAGLRATLGKSAGKWQFELTATGNVPEILMGLAKAGYDFTTGQGIGLDGSADSISVAHAVRDPATGVIGTEVHTSLAGAHTSSRSIIVNGAVYTFACDFDAGTVDIYRNGTLLQAVTGIPAGEWFPALGAAWWPRAALRAVDLAHPVPGFADWTETP